MCLESHYDRYLAWLTRERARVSDLLCPGVTDLRAVEVWSGFSSLPEPVQSIFRCRNGVATAKGTLVGHRQVFPGWIPMSVEESAEAQRRALKDNEWSADLFPVFTSGFGDYLLFDWVGSAYLFFREEPELHLMFTSAEAMWKTVEACVERGVYYVDEQRMVTCHFRAEARVAAELNPGVKHWAEAWGGNETA